MLEAYDEKFGEIASRKQQIILDLASGPISIDTLNKIGIKKMFDKNCKHKVVEYVPPKKDKKKDKKNDKAFYV